MTSKVERGHYTLLRSLRVIGATGLPVAILLAAIILLWIADLKGSYPAKELNLALYFVFSFLTSLLIAVLFARSFLIQGNLGLLLFGCGIVVWGSAAIVSLLAAHDLDTEITIKNSCVWIAALCNLLGASLILRHEQRIKFRESWLFAGYLASLCSVAMIVYLATANLLPDFFVQGQGGTPVRQVILGSAILLFVISALLLKASARQAGSAFLNGYALALLLLAIGILGVMLQSVHSSILGWTGRFAQYLGGVYMLIAALESARKSHVWEISIAGKLDEARATMGAAFSSMTDAVFITDQEGRFIEFNDAFVTFHRFRSRDECWDTFTKYADMFEGFFPDGKSAPAETWPVQRALRGEAGTMELGARRRDTGEQWIGNYSFGPIRDQQGNITGSVVVGRDITERKRAEEALRASEERFRLLSENMTEGLMLFDTEGNLIYQNAAALRIHGFAPDEQVRVAHADLPVVWNVWDETDRPVPFEEWAISRMMRGERVRDLVLRIHQPDNGHEFWASYNGATIYDDQGRSKMMFLTMHDITETRRAQKRAERAHSQLQSLVDNTSSIIYVLDLEERFQMANTVLAALLKSTPEQMIGKRRHEFMPKEDADWHEENDRRVIEEGRVLEFEEYSQLEGRSITWLTAKFPLRDAQGRIYALAGISADISERKRAEETLRESEEGLRQANESLEQRVRDRTMELQKLTEQLEKSRHDLRRLALELVVAEERERKRVAGVLHDEICQTLAVARMRVDMLQGTDLNDESSRYLAEAKEFLVQSIRETRDLMNELGNPLLFDMGVAAACESLADRLMTNHPDIRIRCDISDPFKDLDPDVKAVLFQIIRELLNNVIKHSGARNAHVLVHKDDGRIRAEVRDDGMGFDSQKLGAPTNEGGFGLFSIRERLIAFNGDLWIDSTPEAGTVVAASLPFESEKTPQRGRQALSMAKKARSMKNRILIVDDHALFRDGLRMLINHETDMEVVGEAENGLAAVERARELKPDIILMDVKMPVIDGVESTRQIIAEMPDMKILALSMYSSDGFLTRMMKAGARGYFIKGDDFQELSEVIRKTMGTRSS